MTVTDSSGNVFADLGLPDPEGRLAKARLAYAITAAMRKRGLTPDAAATCLSISPAEVSNIVRGKLGGLTYDRLFALLNALGYEVRVSVEETESGSARVVTTITS